MAAAAGAHWATHKFHFASTPGEAAVEAGTSVSADALHLLHLDAAADHAGRLAMAAEEALRGHSGAVSVSGAAWLGCCTGGWGGISS